MLGTGFLEIKPAHKVKVSPSLRENDSPHDVAVTPDSGDDMTSPGKAGPAKFSLTNAQRYGPGAHDTAIGSPGGTFGSPDRPVESIREARRVFFCLQIQTGNFQISVQECILYYFFGVNQISISV